MNQSLNVAVNYSNANKSIEMSTMEVGQGVWIDRFSHSKPLRREGPGGSHVFGIWIRQSHGQTGRISPESNQIMS